MIAMLVTLMLAGQIAPAPATSTDPANTVSPAIISPRAPDLPSDQDVAQGLNALLKTHPDKVVCLSLIRTGSHMRKRDCRTLRAWYDYEAVRQPGLARALQQLKVSKGDTAGSVALTPPYELLQYVKDRYRSPTVRAEAKARSVQRTKVDAHRPVAADPRISNP